MQSVKWFFWFFAAHYAMLDVTFFKLSHSRKPEMFNNGRNKHDIVNPLFIMPLKSRSILAIASPNFGGTLPSKISERKSSEIRFIRTYHTWIVVDDQAPLHQPSKILSCMEMPNKFTTKSRPISAVRIPTLVSSFRSTKNNPS